MKDYEPISCSFYDRLEEAATLGKEVNLIYLQEGDLESRKTKIDTLKIKNKVEFMVLNDGSEIRLDRIHSIDGIELKNHC